MVKAKTVMTIKMMAARMVLRTRRNPKPCLKWHCLLTNGGCPGGS